MNCIAWMLGFAMCASTSALAFAAEAPPPFTIDAKRSNARFSVQHLFVERVNGSVPITRGTVVMEGELPSGIEATLDASRVATDDPDRDADLQGPDWFDTKRFPTWQFKSTRVLPLRAAAFTVEGLLTVHGVTQPVTLQVTTVHPLPHPAYHIIAHVERHAFGMTVTRMDPLIGPSVELTLDVQLQ